MTRYLINSNAVTVSGQSLNVLPGATVSVYAPDGDLATIYETEGGAAPIENPTTASEGGAINFWVDDLPFIDVEVTFSGRSSRVREYTSFNTGNVPFFASREAALNAAVPNYTNILQMSHGGRVLEYVRDSNGTALTTGDGATWSPSGGISVAHWGVVETDDDQHAKVQACIDWVEADLTSDPRNMVEVDFMGYAIVLADTLVNSQASIVFKRANFVADTTAEWLNPFSHDLEALGNYEVPASQPLIKLGSRFGDSPSGVALRSVFATPMRLDCLGVCSAVAFVGVNELVGEVSVESPSGFGIYIDNVGRLANMGVNVRGSLAGADENIPTFRRAKGLWTNEGDLRFEKVHISNCRENIHSISSPLHADYVHTFGGWKGVRGVGKGAVLSIASASYITDWTISEAGSGYTTGEILYVERYVGDTELDAIEDRHQDPDNWLSIACLQVTSVDGAGGITGLAFLQDLKDNNSDGKGYGTNSFDQDRNLYYVQEIMPINVRLSDNGGMYASQFYCDKGSIFFDGIFKMRVGQMHLLTTDDETSMEGLFRFKADEEDTEIENLEITSMSVRIAGAVDISKLMVFDTTEGSFKSADVYIGKVTSKQTFKTFPNTDGSTSVKLGANAYLTDGYGDYVDLDLLSYGMATQLYDLASSFDLRISERLSGDALPWVDMGAGIFRIRLKDNTSFPLIVDIAWGNMNQLVGRVGGGLKFNDLTVPLVDAEPVPVHAITFDEEDDSDLYTADGGATVQDEVSHSGLAMRLDGSTGYLTVPIDLSTYDAFTVMAWVYREDGDSRRPYLFRQDDMELYLRDNGIIGAVMGGADEITSTGTYENATWTHITVSFDGATTRVYKDAVEVLSFAGTAPATDPFYFGSQNFTPGNPLQGYIDGFGFYGEVLTPEKIAAAAMISDFSVVYNSATAFVDAADTLPLVFSKDVTLADVEGIKVYDALIADDLTHGDLGAAEIAGTWAAVSATEYTFTPTSSLSGYAVIQVPKGFAADDGDTLTTAFRASYMVNPASPLATTTTSNIVYKTVTQNVDGVDYSHDIEMEVVIPSSGTPTKVFVWFHGGAWSGGSNTLSESYSAKDAEFLASLGYATVSVGYRCKDSAGTIVQAYEDADDALDYILANDTALGFTAATIIVSGGSAGTPIAAHLAVTRSEVDGVVGFNGVYDFTQTGGGTYDYYPEDVPNGSFAVVPGRYELDTPSYAENSPEKYIVETPDCLFLHGSQDSTIRFEQSYDMHFAMEEAGATSSLVVVKGEQHAFFNSGKEMYVPMLGELVAFIAAA